MGIAKSTERYLIVVMKDSASAAVDILTEWTYQEHAEEEVLTLLAQGVLPARIRVFKARECTVGGKLWELKKQRR